LKNQNYKNFHHFYWTKFLRLTESSFANIDGDKNSWSIILISDDNYRFANIWKRVVFA
jgi:hypothetical protein